MNQPYELTKNQEALLEAEEAVQDELITYIHLICKDGDATEMLAEIMEEVLFGKRFGKKDTRLENVETKCLAWFDLIVRRKAGL